ncbi:MAG: hypothetical protein ACM3S4_04920 [Burkholderiales bacterium]
MFAITVDGGLITGVHESQEIITEETFKGTLYEGQAVIEVPEDKAANISSGKYLGEYDAAWNLRPLAQRVAEGLVVIPADHVVDGEEIREMTTKEKIDAGLITVDEGYVLDGDTIRPMTIPEKIAAGIASEDDFKAAEAARLQAELNTLYAWFDEYDKQIAQYQRCLRTGEQYDKDIAALDTEANQKQLRIREIRQITMASELCVK